MHCAVPMLNEIYRFCCSEHVFKHTNKQNCAHCSNPWKYKTSEKLYRHHNYKYSNLKLYQTSQILMQYSANTMELCMKLSSCHVISPLFVGKPFSRGWQAESSSQQFRRISYLNRSRKLRYCFHSYTCKIQAHTYTDAILPYQRVFNHTPHISPKQRLQKPL